MKNGHSWSSPIIHDYTSALYCSCFHVDTRDRRNKMAVSWGKLAGGMAVSWGKLAGGKLAYNYSSSCPAASHLAVCVATKHVA